MASGIIGVLTGAASLIYTPTKNAKVKVNCNTNSTGALTVNAVNQATVSTTAGNQQYSFEFYAAAGVPVTIAVPSSVFALISALETT
jgi:hypothetical protein